MSDPIVITREIVKRGWTDFEPKVITGLLTGGAAAFVTSMLGQYDIHLDATSQKLLVVAFYFLGSYLTPSTGQTFTRTISKDLAGLVQEVESHTGNTVTTVTGATPIQHGETPNPVSNRGGVVPTAVNSGQDSVTAILNGTPETGSDADPTVAYGRGQRFLNNLPSTALTSES